MDIPSVNPDDHEFKKQKAAVDKVADKLIQLGYAGANIVRDDPDGGGLELFWTDRGVALKREMMRIFDSVENDGVLDFYEVQAFIILLSNKPKS